MELLVALLPDPNRHLRVGNSQLESLGQSICAFIGLVEGQLGHRMHNTRSDPTSGFLQGVFRIYMVKGYSRGYH
jgi:hypothetical protein